MKDFDIQAEADRIALNHIRGHQPEPPPVEPVKEPTPPPTMTVAEAWVEVHKLNKAWEARMEKQRSRRMKIVLAALAINAVIYIVHAIPPAWFFGTEIAVLLGYIFLEEKL